jgi:hypothetical protein
LHILYCVFPSQFPVKYIFFTPSTHILYCLFPSQFQVQYSIYYLPFPCTFPLHFPT